jgi:hypothetical protein
MGPETKSFEFRGDSTIWRWTGLRSIPDGGVESVIRVRVRKRVNEEDDYQR